MKTKLHMNKKALSVRAIFLVVAMTITVLHNRTAIAQANTDAKAAPKQEAQPGVRLIGITTILDRKQALLQVEPPAGTSGRGTYILSEGQSIDGLTVESIDPTNATVTLRVGQNRKTLRPVEGHSGDTNALEAARPRAGELSFHGALAGQVLQVYRALAGAELETRAPQGALRAPITLERSGVTRAEALELVEKALREQAGIIISRVDSNHLVATYDETKKRVKQ